MPFCWPCGKRSRPLSTNNHHATRGTQKGCSTRWPSYTLNHHPSSAAGCASQWHHPNERCTASAEVLLVVSLPHKTRPDSTAQEKKYLR